MSLHPMPRAEQALLAGIAEARAGSLRWLDAMTTEFRGAPVWRESAACDLQEWPGMALPGTYNAAMCHRLIGDGLDGAPARQSAVIRWIEAQRRPEGHWWLEGMAPGDTFKKHDPEETRAYLIGHVANYTLGALEALGRRPPEPHFARTYLAPDALAAWMAARDWRDPWLEGNNVVNLGGFLLLLAGSADAAVAGAARAALDWLIDWHVENSDPRTGFWGRQESDGERLHAMAGATHNYHLFFALGRPVPHLERAVDFCLTRPPQVVSACIDADLVDILANAAFLSDYRRGEIRSWLAELGAALLAFQNEDGGFADQSEGTRKFDGWVAGYAEPQGISCAFATFFRWIALAMIARVLDPGDRSWGFRRMVGLGYFAHG